MNKLFILLIILQISSVFCQSQTIRQILNQGWTFREYDWDKWYPANVPSTVHLDLLDNGLIQDPYYRAQNLDIYWIEEKDWEYLVAFNLTDKTILNKQYVTMKFHGLDTHADIYLNGQLLFHANNMHRTWVQDVKKLLQPQNNTLRIYFSSSPFHDVFYWSKDGKILPYNYSYSRKASYQYGWDWGPRMVTAGIWKDIEIEGYNSQIQDVYFRTLNITDLSNVKVQMDIDLVGVSGSYQLEVIDTNDQIEFINQTVQIPSSGQLSFSGPFTMNNPKLWWCRNLGEPYLYNFSIILSQQKVVQDSRFQAVGIRTITVVQPKDKTGDGTAFIVRLNGQNVFMKGGNYIPPDMFMPRALKNPIVYNQTLQNAIDANFNMVRIWGGGQFEYDIFYDICDKFGLLIWHDFMFACAMYPGTSDDLDNIQNEIQDNVLRLRNHPSIALWNGNNEVWVGWNKWGWKSYINIFQNLKVGGWYKSIFNKVIPKLLISIDPDRYYWPTSPSNFAESTSTINTGDIHFYGVWGGMDVEENNDWVGRFNSEYGFQGALAFESIKKFSIEGDWSWTSEVMNIHERNVGGFEKIFKHAKTYYGITDPNKIQFQLMVYTTQILQSYAQTTAFEATRRNKAQCMGSLYWQLNDVWPVTSWSGVDYYNTWKAMHYSVRESFKNVMISVYYVDPAKPKQIGIYIVNDNLVAISGSYKITFNTFSGDKEYVVMGQLTLDPNSSEVKIVVDDYIYDSYTASNSFMKTEFFPYNTEEEHTSHMHFLNFTRPLNLKFPQPQVDISYDDVNNLILIQAYTFVKSMYLYLSDYSESLKLSDNYFDVIPGELKVVKLLNDTTTSIKSKLTFMSLYDVQQARDQIQLK